MALRFLGGHDPLDRDRLVTFFEQAAPGARARRDSAFMGNVLVDLTYGDFAVQLEAGKANAERGPRVPWMTVTIPLRTHGIEVDWLREFHARRFQVPIVRDGEFLGTGGPAEVVAAVFDAEGRGALRALEAARGVRKVEIRDDRLVVHVPGWPADAETLRHLLHAAHGFAARATQSTAAFLASGRSLDADPALAAYRAGQRASKRNGRIVMAVAFGVFVAVVLAVVLGLSPRR